MPENEFLLVAFPWFILDNAADPRDPLVSVTLTDQAGAEVRFTPMFTEEDRAQEYVEQYVEQHGDQAAEWEIVQATSWSHLRACLATIALSGELRVAIDPTPGRVNLYPIAPMLDELHACGA
jgi:hypothetical protein